MNESIYTGLYTPQLSRIQEEIQNSRKTLKQQLYAVKPKPATLSKTEEEGQLDLIEGEIKKTGKQLEKLYYEMLSIPDKYSEEYLQKQNERNNLRKNIIDLDYRHKSVYAKKARKNEFKQQSQLSRATKYSRKQTGESQVRKDKMVESKYQRRNNAQKQEEISSPNIKSDKNAEEKVKSQNQKLENSRRKLRIAEIEAELAEEDLIRSRAQLLASELAYIEESYYYPSLLNSYIPTYYRPLDSLWGLY